MSVMGMLRQPSRETPNSAELQPTWSARTRVKKCLAVPVPVLPGGRESQRSPSYGVISNTDPNVVLPSPDVAP